MNRSVWLGLFFLTLAVGVALWVSDDKGDGPEGSPAEQASPAEGLGNPGTRPRGASPEAGGLPEPRSRNEIPAYEEPAPRQAPPSEEPPPPPPQQFRPEEADPQPPNEFYPPPDSGAPDPYQDLDPAYQDPPPLDAPLEDFPQPEIPPPPENYPPQEALEEGIRDALEGNGLAPPPEGFLPPPEGEDYIPPPPPFEDEGTGDYYDEGY